MTLGELLRPFGMDEREQEVYIALSKRGWCTALQLARAVSVKRSTLYRVLEALAKRGLVELQLDDKTTYYNAADPQQFESLVMEQEKKADEMRHAYGLIKSQLKTVTGMGSGTTVRFYRGRKGLEHMEWKMVAGTDYEVLIFGCARWHNYLGEEFAETIRQEMVERRLRVRELINPGEDQVYHTGKEGEANWTRVKEYVLKWYRCRHVPEELMKITEDIYVFEDKVHLRGYREEEAFGVELVHAGYTQMIRDMFELIWRQAVKVDWWSADWGGKSSQ